MLVLSRKKNESIVINDDITIVVVEIRGDKVRLGVEAPKEIPVHRREVFDAIQQDPDGEENDPAFKVRQACAKAGITVTMRECSAALVLASDEEAAVHLLRQMKQQQ